VDAISFTSLAVVAGTAFVAPLLGELVPGLRLPNVALELGLGILVGPSVLGWAHADEPVEVLALLGLFFLLLIAGLEVDYERLRVRSSAWPGSASPGGDRARLRSRPEGRGLVRSPLLIA
jgi:Kef-type K+ transport system membrane component KefB